MYLSKGDHVGGMHCHAPSTHGSTLMAYGYEPKSIIEIDDETAFALANTMPVGFDRLKRENKEGYVVAANDDQVIVLYLYDSSFFLTTLVGKAA